MDIFKFLIIIFKFLELKSVNIKDSKNLKLF